MLKRLFIKKTAFAAITATEVTLKYHWRQYSKSKGIEFQEPLSFLSQTCVAMSRDKQ